MSDSSQAELEVILMRQLASYLVTPIFIVDSKGDLVYYNEPAELLLGRRYDETGELPLSEWSTVFTPYDDDGSPLPPEALPLVIALSHRRPAQRPMRIRGLDGVERRISVTAFPLVGELDRDLGAVAIFWEEPR